MKTYKRLYPQVYAFENLFEAYQRARRAKPKTRELCAFDYALEENLITLREELQTQTYQPSGYRHFYITEPKRRKVSAAPFRDRVVHHALCQVIEPIFESRFIFDSYANRVGKGTHRALARAQIFLRQNKYAFQGDILKCFPSIDHQILLGILGKRLADTALMELIHKIVASGAGVLADEYPMQWFDGDDLFAALRPRGLPIGNLTSQFWANVYLNELDYFVKQELRWRAYVRYVDDFILFGNDKRALRQAHAQITQFLGTLRLRLHPKKQRLYPVRTGVDFVGFVSFPERRKIRRANVKRFVKRLCAQARAVEQGTMAQTAVARSIQSWLAHARHADSYRLRGKLLRRVAWKAPSVSYD